MKKLHFLLAVAAAFLISCQPNTKTAETTKERVSFYKVPLVCGAAPEIGCGSRIKPMFIATEKEKTIKESWTNREGTVIAIVWNDSNAATQQTVNNLFATNHIEATLVTDTSILKELKASFRDNGRWYRGMDVDKLSIEEAGVIAENSTSFALEQGHINSVEAAAIKKDVEDYFKTELVQVRTLGNLTSDSTQERWRNGAFDIAAKHVGKERAEKILQAYEKKLSEVQSCD